MSAAPTDDASHRETLRQRYQHVRAQSVALVAPLSAEDMMVQSMPDASPSKWHLAHTTWFFETFALPDPPSHPEYRYLFNSYYDGIGDRHPRDRRGMISRPSIDEILEYRAAIDARVLVALAKVDEATLTRAELGLHHEMQHQELLLTDIKHALFQNPLAPVYRRRELVLAAPAPLQFIDHDGGLVEIGAANDRFSFDNERPRHRVWLPRFAIASRLVTCGEYLEFIRDRGYERAEFWLADGHRWVTAQAIQAPLYWLDHQRVFTLHGVQPLDPHQPVAHVSYFEADAFARWAGARLPTEAEWEHVAPATIAGRFLEADALHPGGGPEYCGDAWVWTSSAYGPYPGFRPHAGALGEYNGKFMVSQQVLRGGSCLSPRAHLRASYRNFFPPEARWQMTGIRLAR